MKPIFGIVMNIVLVACCATAGAAQGVWRVHALQSLEYPRVAASAQLTGTVQLELEIAPDGSVAKATIKSGNALLAQAAVENAQRWRFERSGNQAAGPSSESLVYTFRLTGVCDAQCCPTTFTFEFPNHVVVETKPPRLQQ